MTLPQYAELAAYWRKFPPAHLLMRAVIGFRESEQDAGDLGALLAEARPGGLFAGARSQ